MPDTQQINSDDLPLYNKAVLPEDAKVIILTEEPDYNNGGTIQLAYRLDLNRILPGSGVQKVAYSLNAPSAGISVPDRTIVPAYVETFEPYNLQRAQASSQTTKAQFLIVSLDPNVDDSYIVQESGYYTFPQDHKYQVGQKYYLSDTVLGGVTTTPPSVLAQPLFTAVTRNTIQINVGA